MMFRLTAATDVGLSRPHNEDNFTLNADLTSDAWLIPEPSIEPIRMGKYGCVFAIADGMGGANAGEVASEIAVSEIAKMFSTSDLANISKDDKSIESFLKETVRKADKSIRKHASDVPASRGMGTTIVMVWVIGGMAHLVWCGDSRAYIFNHTSGLTRFSKDHSYVQELVDNGIINESQAFDHPDSNIITRCLGDSPTEVKPDYKSYYLQPGDFILLCSDGLCGYCRDEEIETILLQHTDDIYNCNIKLIEAALNAGGYDNITTALFQFISYSAGQQNDMSDTASDANKEIENVTLKPYRKSLLRTICSALTGKK